jgi:hypothetical protein
METAERKGFGFDGELGGLSCGFDWCTGVLMLEDGRWEKEDNKREKRNKKK